MEAGSDANYAPQLDGIRALAIGNVLLRHFLPSIDYMPRGEIGVRIFFVLSGFLITRILLGVRERSLATNQPLWLSLRQFYLRRVLRIFPVYYVGLAIAIFGGLALYSETIPWLLTYTVNWYTSIHARNIGHLGHLWSLSVEEQFYLVWPLLALWMSRCHLVWSAIAVVALSMTCRLTMVLLGAPFISVHDNTINSLDALLLGSLLAMAQGTRYQRWVQIGWWVIPVMLLCYGLRVTGHKDPLTMQFVMPVLTAVFAVALVDRAARGGRWMLSPILENRAMRWIGQISYGLYVYHLLVYGGLVAIVVALGYEWKDLGLIRTPLAFICALAVTCASYYGMEKPLARRFKGRMPYILKRC